MYMYTVASTSSFFSANANLLSSLSSSLSYALARPPFFPYCPPTGLLRSGLLSVLAGGAAMPIGPSFLAARSHGTLALHLYIHSTPPKLTYLTRVYTPLHSSSCLASLRRTCTASPSFQQQPFPTNRLISFLVLPNLTSFLYHSSFLELCPNLCCLFNFFFGTRNQNLPSPHVIPILVFARLLARISHPLFCRFIEPI
ncbi:hypothetical protein EDB89DRAFT_1627584 [Lactarius sanguifluus]|nr:hypothetical protein EDB89DRAFT_1627584 [Lactarius sanguifluus]